MGSKMWGFLRKRRAERREAEIERHCGEILDRLLGVASESDDEEMAKLGNLVATNYGPMLQVHTKLGTVAIDPKVFSEPASIRGEEILDQLEAMIAIGEALARSGDPAGEIQGAAVAVWQVTLGAEYFDWLRDRVEQLWSHLHRGIPKMQVHLRSHFKAGLCHLAIEVPHDGGAPH